MHVPHSRWVSLVVCVCAALPLAAQTQSERLINYQIPHIDTPPDIDGVLAPGEWDRALKVAINNETNPGQNAPARVATDALVMEDGEHLLVAFLAADPEPAKIRAYYSERDRSFQDDFVGVVLDTFNDERRAYEFFVNPLGIQMDLTNDDVAGREDESWNAIWDSAGQITDSGFIVEMSIPLKQIRVASGLPQQTWGVDFLRFYPRDARHRFSNNQWDYNATCYLCQLQKAQGFADLQQHTNLQLIPTLTAQASETRPYPATDPWTRHDAQMDAGVDLRWGISEDVILNATLNPDFSQVEADNLQLDSNNTFTLFYPERREFFLDGAEYFNTFDNLVNTRNIQAPDYGIKLTGKSGSHSYGLLAANDQFTNVIIPGNLGSSVATLPDLESDNLAMRYRVDLSRMLTLGTLFTHRDAEGYANDMLSADLNWRLSDSDRIRAQVMASDTDNPLSLQTSYALPAHQSDAAWRLEYGHRGEHFELEAGSFGFGKDYRADLGFVTKADYVEHAIKPSYTWRPGTEHFFNQFGVRTFANYVQDMDGRRLQQNQRAGGWFNGPRQLFVEVFYNKGERYFGERYFTDNSWNLNSRIRPWGGAEFIFNAVVGPSVDFANGRPADVVTLKPAFSLQLGRHLQVRLSHNYQRLRVEGGELFETNLSDLRLTYQFSARSFIRAVVLYSDTARNVTLYRDWVDPRSQSLGTQLLYSYRLNAQTRFFVGYSDNAIRDATVPDLAPTGRSVFAKFSYAWQY
jgi:hypothetical protein